MKIKDLCSYAPKSRIKAGEAVENAKYLFFTSSADENKRYTDFQFDKEAIIMGTGGNATLHYYNGKFSVSTDCLVLFPNSKIKCKYLYYFFKSHMSVLEAGFKGAGLKHTNKKYIEEINVSKVPDLSTQEKIVSHLDTITENIEKLNREVELFDSLTKARFIEMFKSVNDKVTIGSLCDVTSGYSFKSKDINSSNGIKLLQIGNVFFDNVNWETLNYLPDGYNIKYSKFLLNEGDIVVALTRPIIQSLGNVKACVVRELDVPCLLNQRVGRITPKKNIDANLEFIYECLMMNDFTKYVESCCIGCSQPNISVHDIENYLVPNVSFKQQERFVLFKKQVDKSRFDIKKSIIELEREVVYD